MTNWDSEIQDTWEGFGLSIPVVAWGEHRNGDAVKDAILLPTMIGNPKFLNKGYHQIPDMEPKEINGPNGEFVDNPNFGQPKRWESNGKIKVVTVLTLLTDLNGFDFEHFVSEQARKKIEEALRSEEEDDAEFLETVRTWGLRRLYVTGGSLDPNFKTAVKNTTGVPQAGAILTVTHEGKVAHPKKKGVKVNQFGVDYRPPTGASLARVQEYIAKGAPIINRYLQANAQDDVPSGPPASAGAPPRRPINELVGAVAAARSPAVSDDEDVPF